MIAETFIDDGSSFDCIYTVWGNKENPHTMVGNEGPPVFSNGTVMADCDVLWARFRAKNFATANAIYELVCGYNDE